MDRNPYRSEEHPSREGGITRREFLTRVWWGAAGLLVIEAGGGLIVSLWPRLKTGGFGGKVSVGSVEEVKSLPVGSVSYFKEARFYLSRVETGFLALYRKCTHLGCVVPWLPEEPSEDDLAAKGRFNCPCHGSIFDRYGVVHAGPAPRPLDLFPISIEDGELIVDTGVIIQRSSFDESQVAKL
jgi:cytochrome b6-f complex iron-sulfur subunit